MKQFILLATLILIPSFAGAKEIQVVASIKPVHSLVAAVMGDIASPELLVTEDASLHTYHLKPSQVKKVRNADLVFYIDPMMETFLKKSLENLKDKDRAIRLSESKGIELLPVRTGNAWESHAHHEDHEDHDAHEESSSDLHLWLDPDYALIIMDHVVEELSKAYPSHAATFLANATSYKQKIKNLDQEISAQLQPFHDMPYILFHDAFQYFEKQYGLQASGSLTLDPEIPPSVERMQSIKKKITSQNILCVFQEPQFSPRLVETLMEGTAARSGILDEHGSTLAPGPDLYLELLQLNANHFSDCLMRSKQIR